MKNQYVLAIFLLWARNGLSTTFIKGEHFFGVHRPNSEIILNKELINFSTSFDSVRCEAWISDEVKEGVEKIDAEGNTVHFDGTYSRLVSDIINDRLFAISKDATELLELQASTAKVTRRLTKTWASEIIRIEFDSNEEAAWALIERDHKHLEIIHLDENLNDVKKTVIVDNADLWNKSRLIRNHVTDTLWVGFTATTASKMYSPHAQNRKTDGSLIQEYRWSDKGIFFDFCEDGSELLFSRDFPSNSGFTVPVYSYLESLRPGGKWVHSYEADVNLFIDALSCHKESILMAQRSIFGSDGTTLVEWDRKIGSPGTKLANLPGPTEKLFRCLK